MSTKIEQRIDDYIKDKNESSISSTINKSFWTELKWNEDKYVERKKLYLTEEKSIWELLKFQLLELRFWIFDEKFKNLKEELKKLKGNIEESPASNHNEDENEEENLDNTNIIWSNNEFIWTKVSEIQSQPFYKNPETWVTRCAATANFNAQNFGLNLPWWNAYDAATNPWLECIKTEPNLKKNQRPNNNRSPIKLKKFTKLDSNVNFADLYTGSTSNFWHRAVWFRDAGWERYVLDPYTTVNGVLGNKPYKLADYIANKKIVKAHFYNSPWYKFESKQYQ